MIIFAHRGASGYEPENTLRSFKRAITLGAKAIECDVWKCKSGELVVIHDEKVNRTTNGKGYVKKLRYQTLKSLDAGHRERVPLLQEVMATVRGKAILNIEIKDESAVLSLARVLKKEFVTNRWREKDVIVSSFNHATLRNFHRLCPGIALGALTEHFSEKEINNVVKNKFSSLNVPFEKITKDFVSSAHLRRVKVFAWTVNTKVDVQKMKRMEVDGIFTNFPDRVLK